MIASPLATTSAATLAALAEAAPELLDFFGRHFHGFDLSGEGFRMLAY